MTTNTDHTQELTDKINESITALCAETDAAKQNETYRAWLRTLSRFYSYSFNNWLLIYTQRSDATRVAGFQTWKSLGRFVKKGERGIRIFAPIIRKVEETERRHRTGFAACWIPLYVFDRLSRDLCPAQAHPVSRVTPVFCATATESNQVVWQNPAFYPVD